MEKLNICDIEDGALDTEFDLRPEGSFDRTKRPFSRLPTKPSSTTSSRRKDSSSVRLHRSTRSERRN